MNQRFQGVWASLVILFIIGLPVNAQNSVMLSYYETANTAFNQQKWSEAEKYYKLAVKEGERIGLKNWGMAETLHNVAASLGNQNKYEDALLPFP